MSEPYSDVEAAHEPKKKSCWEKTKIVGNTILVICVVLNLIVLLILFYKLNRGYCLK
ncbi:hypothetical protein TVAG_344380 [Trichomonas vaginalis G3]|uniref:Uncharacterized protein n=1 Tax=Trichomonas vaginalis (strain ATCC PRA-98 / G3) TaxID=412133 RepID=A2E7Q9_TRIV3|nr:hypothetical protein TVAGG3_0598800 [Trichomonas vaginalis G3]EAX77997.1 hypothetical protein TVAG_311250 [Trichomonas vaginalis G3]EAX93016.1 hypothetical protein TVAG_007400 [Trichomonas vaginalis G3]EAY11344.1 hypothetical protein TVAG_344380 [Trichomonas vaginalis G3]KAI5523791.1 hypothetical protein TVAGG3_0598800 [Trichomonas vaginalis G3]|eukprot:XP_001290927.1 hypothetical protein [Trichomonas vaginalis G3]